MLICLCSVCIFVKFGNCIKISSQTCKQSISHLNSSILPFIKPRHALKQNYIPFWRKTKVDNKFSHSMLDPNFDMENNNACESGHRYALHTAYHHSTMYDVRHYYIRKITHTEICTCLL